MQNARWWPSGIFQPVKSVNVRHGRVNGRRFTFIRGFNRYIARFCQIF